MCPAGTENKDMNDDTPCTDCPRGYYRTSERSQNFRNCTKCTGTKTTEAEGSINAANCTIGK